MVDNENKPPQWLLPDKAYDVMKWIGLIVCPALATFMLTVGNSIGIPYTAEIATCITAAGTFIGAIIGASAIKGSGANDE
ncbi:MAG: phage holin [Eggerthellaceae bacterium]